MKLITNCGDNPAAAKKASCAFRPRPRLGKGKVGGPRHQGPESLVRASPIKGYEAAQRCRSISVSAKRGFKTSRTGKVPTRS